MANEENHFFSICTAWRRIFKKTAQKKLKRIHRLVVVFVLVAIVLIVPDPIEKNWNSIRSFSFRSTNECVRNADKPFLATQLYCESTYFDWIGLSIDASVPECLTTVWPVLLQIQLIRLFFFLHRLCLLSGKQKPKHSRWTNSQQIPAVKTNIPNPNEWK